MKKDLKKYTGIVVITILALILRVLFINKPDGLWNDEYISWMIASMPFFDGFANGVKSQCHMPFYYLYLKFFMTLLGQNDIILRLTSVFAGVLSVIAMYFTGCEKDKQTGLLCAGFTAISSFLIYYSQEVRFYSVLFLFSAMSLLYTLKTIKQPCKKNFIICLLFNLLIVFTHTIGFVFVFFNLIFISINLFKQYKKVIIILWTAIATGFITALPLIMKIFTTQAFSQWWGSFSFSKIGFLFTDYFSPILTNLTNSPDNFFYNLTYEFIIFALIPAIIALAFLVKGLKNKINTELFLAAAASTIVLVIASLSGKLVFITKYSIEIYPALIFIMCYGISQTKNIKLKNALIITYCILSLGYLIFNPSSASRIRHSEGHKIAADLINNTEPKSGDVILLEYYPQNRFEKYFDFSPYKVVSIDKGNFYYYLSNNISYNDAYKNGKILYKDMLSYKENNYFKDKLKETVTDGLKSGQSVILVTLDSVSFYQPEKVIGMLSDEKAYKNASLLFLLFSYIKEKSFNELAETLTVTRVEKKGNWTVIKFTKLNK